jgi:hypothetical protein
MTEPIAGPSAAFGAATPHTGTPAVRATPTKGAASFAGQLARLVDAPDGAAKAPARPQGEKTKKVADHPYSSVESGPDKGMFLNQLAGSPRKGSVFKMVEREDHVFHVYGTGKEKVVVEVKPAGKGGGSAGPATGGAAPTPS